MIAWHEFDGARAYGFAVAHGLPVVARVYRTGDDGFGWGVAEVGGHLVDGFAGGDADSVDEAQRWCALALADWSREQDAREAAERAVTDRWAAGFGEVGT